MTDDEPALPYWRSLGDVLVDVTSHFPIPADTHDAGAKRRIPVPRDVRVEAEINGAYRPKLRHTWGVGGRYVLWLMMNPSDARIEYTDATVAKCGRLSRRWGFDGLLVGNAADYRHNDPKTLVQVDAPRSERNIPAILEMIAEAEMIVFAYGRLPRGVEYLAHQMREAVFAAGAGDKCFALKLLEDGTPGHPLFVSESSVPVRLPASGDPQPPCPASLSPRYSAGDASGVLDG